MSDMLGRPLIILPYSRPGCLDRLGAFLGRWLVRVVLVLIGFLWGYACQMGRG